MISRRAPGKLFVAGEYAVVEPGRHAVLVAVDRYATVTVTESEKVTLRTDLDGGHVLGCLRSGPTPGPDATHGPLVPDTADGAVPPRFAYVFAAVSVLERLLAERGIDARPYALDVRAELGSTDGRKYGLGSSAAVTVATIDALGEFHDLGLTVMDRYRLAMLATIAVNPRASGGDIAASTWGGWVAYSSPDRAEIADLVATDGVDTALGKPWPGLSVRTLPTPTSVDLLVGWTGSPASTPALVAALGNEPKPTEQQNPAARHRTPAQHEPPAEPGTEAPVPPAARPRRTRAEFATGSDACVQRLVTAIEADDAAAIRAEIDTARALLLDLDASSGLGIMTPLLHALCEAGAAVGAAAKPSGAGGGDCGIAIVGRDRAGAAAELTGRWISAGIEPLPLRLHPFEGDRA
ncbi:phosphomevalonate kinase [Nocardia thailandica]